jgi:hypothetical protein
VKRKQILDIFGKKIFWKNIGGLLGKNFFGFRGVGRSIYPITPSYFSKSENCQVKNKNDFCELLKQLNTNIFSIN